MKALDDMSDEALAKVEVEVSLAGLQGKKVDFSFGQRELSFELFSTSQPAVPYAKYDSVGAVAEPGLSNLMEKPCEMGTHCGLCPVATVECARSRGADKALRMRSPPPI